MVISMEKRLRATNLYRYATSELSQDAFICWLLSHLTEEGWEEDPQIRECAICFLNCIFKAAHKEMYRVYWRAEIKKQYKNIDVLVVVNDYHIIIEDKTFTNSHNEQISRYKKAILDEGVPEENILCVFYKIEDQPKPEENVDYEFTRKELLDLFEPFKDIIRNPIFTDYVEYLEWMEWKRNAFTKLPIGQWDNDVYTGFFKHLTQTLLKDAHCSWGYVPNPSGGFMGLWWGDILNSDELNTIGLTESLADELYIQIENDIITIKYTVDKKKSPDMGAVGEIRWKLYEYFSSQIAIASCNSFQKSNKR